MDVPTNECVHTWKPFWQQRWSGETQWFCTAGSGVAEGTRRSARCFEPCRRKRWQASSSISALRSSECIMSRRICLSPFGLAIAHVPFPCCKCHLSSTLAFSTGIALFTNLFYGSTTHISCFLIFTMCQTSLPPPPLSLSHNSIYKNAFACIIFFFLSTQYFGGLYLFTLI